MKNSITFLTLGIFIFTTVNCGNNTGGERKIEPLPANDNSSDNHGSSSNNNISNTGNSGNSGNGSAPTESEAERLSREEKDNCDLYIEGLNTKRLEIKNIEERSIQKINEEVKSIEELGIHYKTYFEKQIKPKINKEYSETEEKWENAKKENFSANNLKEIEKIYKKISDAKLLTINHIEKAYKEKEKHLKNQEMQPLNNEKEKKKDQKTKTEEQETIARLQKEAKELKENLKIENRLTDLGSNYDADVKGIKGALSDWVAFSKKKKEYTSQDFEDLEELKKKSLKDVENKYNTSFEAFTALKNNNNMVKESTNLLNKVDNFLNKIFAAKEDAIETINSKYTQQKSYLLMGYKDNIIQQINNIASKIGDIKASYGSTEFLKNIRQASSFEDLEEKKSAATTAVENQFNTSKKLYKNFSDTIKEYYSTDENLIDNNGIEKNFEELENEYLEACKVINTTYENSKIQIEKNKMGMFHLSTQGAINKHLSHLKDVFIKHVDELKNLWDYNISMVANLENDEKIIEVLKLGEGVRDLNVPHINQLKAMDLSKIIQVIQELKKTKNLDYSKIDAILGEYSTK